MFKDRSKTLFVCAVLATIYCLYLIIYFGNSMTSNDGAEVWGGLVATTLVMPHIVMIALGAIFSWLGFCLRKSWAALVGAILYCVATVLFFLYALFTIPLIVLGFVGYTKQKKFSN